MEIIVRHMEAKEAKAVKVVGRQSFSGVEGLWISTPKQALVAEVDGAIRGAILYKIIKAGGKKIGYVDYAFVHSKFHNQGIGGKLYKESIAYLWSLGCDVVTAAVKDDNVGSFGLFEKNGLKRVSIADLVRIVGLQGMLKQYFLTPLCICVGMDFYLAVPEGEAETKKGEIGREFIFYLLGNLVVLSAALVRGVTNGYLEYAGAILALLSGVFIVSYGAAKMTKEKWHFRVNNGGFLVSILVSMMNFFPVFGGFYPEKYENSDKFRRMLGIHAMIRWLCIMLVVAGTMLAPETIFLNNLKYVSTQFLIYHILAFYPFEVFGGKRVYEWNKGIFICMALVSVILLFLV